MPRVDIRDALAEVEERAGDFCVSCSASVEEGFEPYCRNCGVYWQEIDAGLFADCEDW